MSAPLRQCAATMVALMGSCLAPHVHAAQPAAPNAAEAPRRTAQPPREPRDRASQIINPHLGPRWPNGQLRDGASQIINPPVQPMYSPPATSGIAGGTRAPGPSWIEGGDRPGDDRLQYGRDEDGTYRRR